MGLRTELRTFDLLLMLPSFCKDVGAILAPNMPLKCGYDGLKDCIFTAPSWFVRLKDYSLNNLAVSVRRKATVWRAKVVSSGSSPLVAGGPSSFFVVRSSPSSSPNANVWWAVLSFCGPLVAASRQVLMSWWVESETRPARRRVQVFGGPSFFFVVRLGAIFAPRCNF